MPTPLCARGLDNQQTSQVAQRAARTADRIDRTLEELMQSLGSMSGTLLGGDTLLGLGADAAGVRVCGGRGTRKTIQ